MDPAKISDLDIIFKNIVTVSLTLAGLAVLVMLVSGGLGYLMAGSDKEGAQKAQRTLTYAIGGLVLTVAAWVIMSTLGSFFGISFGSFSVCLPGQSC